MVTGACAGPVVPVQEVEEDEVAAVAAACLLCAANDVAHTQTAAHNSAREKATREQRIKLGRKVRVMGQGSARRRSDQVEAAQRDGSAGGFALVFIAAGVVEVEGLTVTRGLPVLASQATASFSSIAGLFKVP